MGDKNPNKTKKKKKIAENVTVHASTIIEKIAAKKPIK